MARSEFLIAVKNWNILNIIVIIITSTSFFSFFLSYDCQISRSGCTKEILYTVKTVVSYAPNEQHTKRAAHHRCDITPTTKSDSKCSTFKAAWVCGQSYASISHNTTKCA